MRRNESIRSIKRNQKMTIQVSYQRPNSIWILGQFSSSSISLLLWHYEIWIDLRLDWCIISSLAPEGYLIWHGNVYFIRSVYGGPAGKIGHIKRKHTSQYTSMLI